eukprot:456628-Rhodomonas_salina.2
MSSAREDSQVAADTCGARCCLLTERVGLLGCKRSEKPKVASRPIPLRIPCAIFGTDGHSFATSLEKKVHGCTLSPLVRQPCSGVYDLARVLVYSRVWCGQTDRCTSRGPGQSSTAYRVFLSGSVADRGPVIRDCALITSGRYDGGLPARAGLYLNLDASES